MALLTLPRLASARALILMATVATSPVAQNVVVSDAGTATFVESSGSSPLYPGGGVGPLAIFPQLFPLPPGPPIPAPAGGVTLDGTSGQIWYSDGFVIASQPHAAYASGIPPTPPFPVPPVLGLPLTGLAIDPVAGILWITDGFGVAGLAPLPGGPVVVPPFVPGFGPMPPMMGLEWDPLTASLFAVDVGGAVYNFLPGGAPLGPPVAPPIPIPGPAAGIAIDKAGLGIGGIRSLYVVTPGAVIDYGTAAVFPSGGGGIENGIAYHPAPSLSPPGPPCPCPGMPFGQALLGPSTVGNPAFGIDLVGLPPGQLVIFAFDFAGYNPAFPLLNVVGCPFGLTGAGFGFGGFADAFGTATFPFSLAVAPVGAVFYMQYVTLCPADPGLGVVITPLYQVAIAAP